MTKIPVVTMGSKHPEKFDINQPDVKGNIPAYSLVGTRWRHFKNEKVYEITGFEWDSERDLWVIQHKEVLEINSVVPDKLSDHAFVRTPKSFFGKVRILYQEKPIKRFVQVK